MIMQLFRLLWLLIIGYCVLVGLLFWLKGKLFFIIHCVFVFLLTYLLFLLEIDYVDLALISMNQFEALLFIISVLSCVLLLVIGLIKINKTK